MDPSSFEDHVARQLDQLVSEAARVHGEDPGAAGLLIALSGGPDSVALLAAAVAWARTRSRPLAAAHFNHDLRGADSDADQRFCEDLCARFDLSLATAAGDPRGLARRRGRGLEDAARQLRHDFLEKTRAASDLAAVATGHHRDDQAETVIMRLFRGTGLDGLRGLRPLSGRRLHPLLGVTRAEILAYLAGRDLTWRQDPTNLDGSNRRSRLRHELLPLVRDIFGEGSGLNPARLADLAEIDLAHLDQLTDQAWQRLSGPAQPGHTGASLHVSGVKELPPAVASRVIRRWLHQALPADLARVHVDAVRRWLEQGRSGTGLDLPGPLRLERVFDRVGLAGTPPPSDDAAHWQVRVEPRADVPLPPPPPHRDLDGTWRLICPSETLQGNLRLRNPRPGDRLEPFGLDGTKKLSDLMQEKRIPTVMRAGLLVVEDSVGILWIPDLAQAERTRVLPSTRQAVTIIVGRRHSLPGE